MIVGTKKVSVYLKGLVGKDDFLSTTIESIMASIPENPEETKKNIFVISSDDVKSPRVRQPFADSLEQKHEGVRILYIDKTRAGLPGLDPKDFDIVIPNPPKGDKQKINDALQDLMRDIDQYEKGDKNFLSRESVDEDYEPPTTDLSEEDETTLLEEEVQSIPQVVEQIELPTELVSEPIEELPALVPPSHDGYMYHLKKMEGESLGAALILSEFAKAEFSSKEIEAELLKVDVKIEDVLNNKELYAEEKLSKLSELTEEKNKLKSDKDEAGVLSVDNIIDRLVESATNDDGALDSDNKPPIVALIDEMAKRLAKVTTELTAFERKHLEEMAEMEVKMGEIKAGIAGGFQKIREEKPVSSYHIVTSDMDSVSLSYMLARQSNDWGNNVAYIDLTNSGMLECFVNGIISVEDLLTGNFESGGLLVASSYDNDNPFSQVELDIESFKEMLEGLHSKFYEVIVSVGLDQLENIEKLKELTTVFTHLIDCTPANIRAERTAFGGNEDSLDKAILLNCLGNAEVIKDSLGMSKHTLDNLVVLEPIKEIREKVLNNEDPFEVESVQQVVKDIFNRV
jgi:hypothetical protein